MPTLAEVITIATGDGPKSDEAIDVLAAHRRTVAASLLSAGDDDRGLTSRLGEVAELAAASFPWDPVAEDYELARRIIEQWTDEPAPPTRVVMAAMALAPAHHFPAPLRLAHLPPWLRTAYAKHLLCCPPIFLHTGEADHYATHCARAMAALSEAIFKDYLPEAVELAGLVYLSDSLMLYFNEQSLREYFSNKAKISEFFIRSRGARLEFSFPLFFNEIPNIGILHRSLSPGTETYYLLAHLIGRDKSALNVTLYLRDSSPSPLREVIIPWVDKIVELPADIFTSVGIVRRDRLDVCLVTNNVAAGPSPETIIAAHRLAKIQVAGAASPVTTGLSSFDFFLSGDLNEPSTRAQDEYEEALVRLPGAVTYYAFTHDREPQTLNCSRGDLGVSEGQVVFFSAANFYKITPELLIAWAQILARTPGSRLILMPFNPNWQQKYPVALFNRRLSRALLRFGVAPSRVTSIAKVPSRADLHAVMRLADIYLDSFPFSGACSLVDPLLLGLPIVARRGRTFRSSVASSILSMDGLDEAICEDDRAYVSRAVQLATQTDLLNFRRKQILPRRSPSSIQTEPFAHAFTEFCAEVSERQRNHVRRLRNSNIESLRLAVADAVSVAFAEPSWSLRRLADSDIVSRLLVPYMETLAAEGGARGRIIDIGACMGSLSMPFLEAGFSVDMFEPDPDCAAPLAALVARFPASARHHAMAVTSDPVTTISFNKRSIGLSGLGESPFGDGASLMSVPATTLRQFFAQGERADVIKIDAEGSDFELLRSFDLGAVKPSAILIEFGVHFSNQSVDEIRRLVRDLAVIGYAAVIFEYRKLNGFGSTNWDHELAAVAMDASNLGEAGDAFGDIVFARQDDATFLTCLVTLLESFAPAKRRPFSTACQ